jgi:CubicO group peptidase (beta-lactamase class C family)
VDAESRRPRARTALALLGALCILLAGCAPTAQDAKVVVAATPTPTPIPDERPELSDAALAQFVDPAKPGCSAAVAVHGTVVWAKARGMANLATGEQLTPTTRFDIASLTKQFTATAILMLQREGKLSLGDPISSYVPGLPSWGATITLDALMHHTSHIWDFWTELHAEGIDFGDSASEAVVVHAIARSNRLTPGSGYEYSNSNYVLLAEVVQKVSGEALPDYLSAHIFAPLGLAMTLTPGLQAPDVAISYDDNDKRIDSGWGAYGYSEIFTTSSELARWGDQYRESSIVLDDFKTGAVDNGKGGLYAAGINIQPGGSLRHDGRFGGNLTTFRVSPDRETTIVVLCNGHLDKRTELADELALLWYPTTQGD